MISGIIHINVRVTSGARQLGKQGLEQTLFARSWIRFSSHRIWLLDFPQNGIFQVLITLLFVNPTSTVMLQDDGGNGMLRHQMRYYLTSLYLCKTNGLHQLSEARNQI